MPPLWTLHTVDLGSGRGMTVNLAVPDVQARNLPTVIVLHEVFGLTDGIRAAGERFVDLGWAVVAPEFLTAGRKIACLARNLREVASHVPGESTRRLAQVVRWSTARPEVDGERLATVGFCLGGGFALLLGGLGMDGMRAIAANYADVPDVATVGALPPVVASYGGRDRQFGPKARVLEERLGACGISHDVKVYDGAGHGFMTDERHPIAALLMPGLHAGYVPAASDDAWDRMTRFLAGQLTDRPSAVEH